MKIEVHGVDMAVSENLRDNIEKKLSKFHRYFDDEALCTVKIEPDHKLVKLELTLKSRSNLFRVESTGADAVVTLDEAVDNMERKLRKHKSKLKKRRKEDQDLVAFLDDLASPDEDAVEEKEAAPQVIRHKRFLISPMSTEEAALQMELVDHDFFLYLNPETGKVCLLYKRADGNYGILEPEY